MFKNKKSDSLKFASDNYIMNDSYSSENLVVAKLEYILSEVTPHGPMVEQTNQKYIFEIMKEKGKIRYREIFTGFIADTDDRPYFDLPYVVNIVPLKEQLPSVKDELSKYSLLLVMNEVNEEKVVRKLENKNE